jgi:hypothetical protein
VTATFNVLLLESGGRLARPNRARQLDVPDGTALIEGTFFLDEGWSYSANDPDVNIRRLLANQRCYDPGDTSELDLDGIMHSLTRRAD